MLTKSLKISDTTKTENLEWIFFQSDQKTWQKAAVRIQVVFRIL